MGLSSIFKPAGLLNAYSGLKSVVSSVYRPINSVIHSVANGVLRADKYVRAAADHPVLRDVASLFIDNPIYKEIINLIKDVRDGADVIAAVGGAADNLITKELSGVQIMRPVLRAPQQPLPPPSGSVASAVM
jgi:hypothetical protein